TPSASTSVSRFDRTANSASSAFSCSPRAVSSRWVEENCISDDMIFCSRICIAAVFTFKSCDVVSSTLSLVRNRSASSRYCCSRESLGGGCNHLLSVLMMYLVLTSAIRRGGSVEGLFDVSHMRETCRTIAHIVINEFVNL